MINRDFFHLQRFPSHEVIIGDRPMGGVQPIRLQSMTNTNTLDIKATIKQSIGIIEAGADYVRISTPNIAAAEALQEIQQGIKKTGFTNPLIADIHFNADVALTAARYVAKVRINPGNYTGNAGKAKSDFSIYDAEQEKEKILLRLKPLVGICKEYGTAVRIGTNLGSLSPRIIHQYGNTPTGMVEATYEFLELFGELGFKNLVISLKASKPIVMIEAYEAMVEKMLKNHMSFPLHIGITEAGEGENGRIKSALGICSLLNKGIGDTLRVSLTEDPEKEIPFALKLSSLYQIPFAKPKQSEYVLEKSDFYQDEILVTEQNLRAIVIADASIPGTEEKPHIGVSETELRRADYLFAINEQTAQQMAEKTILLPYASWKKNPLPNTIPLIECPQQRNLALHNELEQYFIRICCKENTSSEFIGDQKGLIGLIADLNSCREEVEMQHWIDFSQQKRIPLIIRKSFQTADINELISHFAIFAGNYLLEKKIQGIWINAPAIRENVTAISYGFLQSAGIRITTTEFISCPTCARTSYNLQQVLKDIQRHTSQLPGLKIAVMGCVVNGPGEMADADYGFVGTGNGKLHLYKGRNPIKKNIEPSDATQALLEILLEDGFQSTE